MLAWFAYLVVSLVWGSTFLAIAYAIPVFTPLGLSAARLLPAGLLALAIGRLRRERLPSRRELPHLALVGVLLLGVCMAIIAWAEGRVDSGLAATLAASVPLFLGLLEPGSLDRRGWCGLALGFAGVLVLLPPGSDRSMLMGMAALLGSSFLWAFGTLHGKRHGGQGGHFSQVGLEMLVAGLLSLALAPLAGGIRRGPVTPASLAALGYLVLFGSILAYTAYIHLAKAWPAARAGTYAYWNPVVGLALGCWLRAEPFRPRTLPGLGLILLGVALVQVPGRAGRSPLHPLSEAMSITKRYFTSPFSSRS